MPPLPNKHILVLNLPKKIIDRIYLEIEHAINSSSPEDSILKLFALLESLNVEEEQLENISKALTGFIHSLHNTEYATGLKDDLLYVFSPTVQDLIVESFKEISKESALILTLNLYRALNLSLKSINLELTEKLIQQMEKTVVSMFGNLEFVLVNDEIPRFYYEENEAYYSDGMNHPIDTFEDDYTDIGFPPDMDNEIVVYINELYMNAINSPNPLQSLVILKNYLLGLADNKKLKIIKIKGKRVFKADLRIIAEEIEDIIADLMTSNSVSGRVTKFENNLRES